MFLLIFLWFGVFGIDEFGFLKCRNHKTNLEIFETKMVQSSLSCATSCSKSNHCVSVNVCRQDQQLSCDLSTFYPSPICSSIDPDTNCTFLQLKNPCRNGGVYTASNKTCSCNRPYVGNLCERVAYNCRELNDKYGITSTTEEVIQPPFHSQRLNVRCAKDQIEAWSIFHLPSFPKPTYTSTWEDAKYFRPPQRFVGTETLHIVTNAEPCDLKVFLTGGSGPVTIYYHGFRVKSEEEKYAFDYDSYNCTIGCDSVIDGLAMLRGEPFSTGDRDVYDCVNASGICWWFNSDCGPVSPHNPLTNYAPSWPRNLTSLNSYFIFSGLLINNPVSK